MADIVELLEAVAAMDLRTGPILAHTLDTAAEAAKTIKSLRRELVDWKHSSEAYRIDAEVLKDQIEKGWVGHVERI